MSARRWRWAALGLAALLGGCGTAGYYWQSVHGHLALMAAARPIDELLADPATHAALEEGEPWRQALLAYLRANRALLHDAVTTRMPALKLAWPLEATYLAWIDARGLGVDDPHAHFEKAGVGLSSGADFAAPGFLHLNFGCTRATLTEALDRMARACG